MLHQIMEKIKKKEEKYLKERPQRKPSATNSSSSVEAKGTESPTGSDFEVKAVAPAAADKPVKAAPSLFHPSLLHGEYEVSSETVDKRMLARVANATTAPISSAASSSAAAAQINTMPRQNATTRPSRPPSSSV